MSISSLLLPSLVIPCMCRYRHFVSRIVGDVVGFVYYVVAGVIYCDSGDVVLILYDEYRMHVVDVVIAGVIRILYVYWGCMCLLL